MGVPRRSANYGKFSILLNRNKWKAQGHGHKGKYKMISLNVAYVCVCVQQKTVKQNRN